MTDGFDLFIADLFGLFNELTRQLASNRPFVIASGRRAMAVLRAYRPGYEGEEILIETAIEQFEALVERAGGYV